MDEGAQILPELSQVMGVFPAGETPDDPSQRAGARLSVANRLPLDYIVVQTLPSGASSLRPAA